MPADHPRSRGVYAGVRDLQGADTGIIPARAGFTMGCFFSGRVTWGSSPLARGLPILFHASRGQIRIIPARAGFT